jgi:hypothetical protein
MHVHKGLKGHTVWFEDHTVWFGTIFLIVCAMIASHHNCPNSKEKIVYKKAIVYEKAKECKKPQSNPEVRSDEVGFVYYWNDSKKQCDWADLSNSSYKSSAWACDDTSASISSTYNTLVVICKGLESKGKTGTVLFSTHRDDNNEKAFYLKKLVDRSSVLNHWTKETRHYFWRSEADCMVSGPSKRASRLKTYQ